ncbi:hypothetical protein TIFTF001_051604 [Ficus carica]|uniref:Uncharacterized protein n=1 Tax=Ficus carica TaxID=3494 RepID=A0AA88D5H7_FICCA|nr:hypothetical protein TIFTF001_051604 [Ficus carica]
MNVKTRIVLTQSFSIERASGKKCFMVGARGLSIAWGDTPQYWKWISLPESRFPEVAKLSYVLWLHVIAKVETRILSPQTTYVAYFVFKLAERKHGFENRPVQLHVDFEGRENGEGLSEILDSRRNIADVMPQDRGDGWKEVEMGEFINEDGEDGSVLCSLKERYWHRGGISQAHKVGHLMIPLAQVYARTGFHSLTQVCAQSRFQNHIGSKTNR